MCVCVCNIPELSRHCLASPPTSVVGDALHRICFGEFVSFRVEHVVVWGFLPALPPFPSPQPFPCTERDRSITPLFLKRRRLVATHRLDCRGERPSDRFVQKATGFVHPIPSAVVPFTQPFPCTEHDRSIVPLFLKRRRLVSFLHHNRFPALSMIGQSCLCF